MREVGVHPLGGPVVEGQHVVPDRLDEEQLLELGQLVRHLGRKVVRLRPVLGRVVELPDVQREVRRLGDHVPGRAVLGHRGPAVVVDPAVAHQLEVLRGVPLGGVSVVERVRHRAALHRDLGHAVDGVRLGQPGEVEDGRRDVDDVVPLVADLAPGLDPARPVHDGAVAGAAVVGGDLLGPLVRRAHRVRPAHGVVVVGLRATDLVQVLVPELRGLELVAAVGGRGDHVGAVEATLGGSAVVADDVHHQGVVEQLEVLEGVDHPSGVEVGVLQEPGVHLHLVRQDRLALVGDVVPGGDALGPGGQVGVRRDHPELLLPGERRLARRVPAVVEPAAVLRDPLLRHVVRGVRRTGCEVDEERLVRGEALLLADVLDGLVREVRHQVVVRVVRRVDGGHSVDERRGPLVRLAADETVEALEAREGRPVVERTGGAGLPDRHLVTFAELGRVVAVLPQDLRQRDGGVRPGGAVARRGRGGLGDVPHADLVVVAAAEQGRPGGGAERGGVEARVLQAGRRQPLGGRVCAPARRTRWTRRSPRRRAGSPARSAPAPVGGRGSAAGRRWRPAVFASNDSGPW